MKSLLIALFVFTQVASSYGQAIISGKVVSAHDNVPLTNASMQLIVAGRNLSVGRDGTFAFPINGSDTLVLTHVGYATQRIPIDEHTTYLNIQMIRQDNLLDEVEVSTGYYRVPLDRATGSFIHVDEKSIGRSVGSNILSRLEGMANGLQFNYHGISGESNAAPTLRIRGVSTIESDEAPLIVLDNFPYEGDINSINPENIESITILRDAAAASIWGAKAGNGVIVITSKQGRYGQPARISLTSAFTVGEKPDLFYSKRWLPAETVMSIEKERFELGDYVQDPEVPLPPYVELLMDRQEGRVTENDFERVELEMMGSDVRRDALNYLYRPSFHQQYSLGLRGGGNRYRYYVSGGLDNNAASLKRNDYRRLSLNMLNTFMPMPAIEMTLGIWYAQQQSANNGLTLTALNPTTGESVAPYVRLADESGAALAIPFERSIRYQQAATASGLLDWQYRPLDELRLSDKTTTQTEYRVNTDMKFNVTPGLSVLASYQYLQGKGGGRNYFHEDTYYVRNLVNRFTQKNGSTIIPHNAILDGGRNTDRTSHSARLQVNMDRDFEEYHQVAALAGAEIRHLVVKGTPGFRIYNYNDELLTGTTTYNFNQSYPVLPSGNARLPAPQLGLSERTDRYLSYFGNIGYNYMSKYGLSTSLRWDASNLFGVKTNQRGVPLWSVGISWGLSSEPFYKSRAIPYVRLRATYGSSGNVNNAVSTYPTIVYTAPINGFPVATLTSVGNPALRWEKVKTFNVGLDIRSKDNDLTASLEYYVKNAADLIGKDYMSPSTGIHEDVTFFYIENLVNYANMNAQGADLQVNMVKRKGEWAWSNRLLVSYVRNRITHINTAEVDNIGYYLADSPPPAIGQSRDVVYALPWNGLRGDDGMPLIHYQGEVSKDYRAYYANYDPSDLIVSGVKVAPFFGSYRPAIGWKGLEISALFSFKAGYVFRRLSQTPNAEYDNGYHMDYFKRWQKSGDEKLTDVPAKSTTTDVYRNAAYSASEALITKGDHLRLQDVRVGYAFRGNALQFLRLQSLNVYFYARNLGVLWQASDSGIDPEYPNARYPASRTVAFGVQTTF